MTILRGWAVPLQIAAPADHTYVTCDGGKVWPCWGRGAGGKQVCAGNGSSIAAQCISWPKSTAKLIYGVTGVCHQTANRILWPAGVTVRAARGYWASWLLYGTYGKGLALWLGILAACGFKKGDLPECLPKGGSKVEEGAADDYSSALADYYSNLSIKADNLESVPVAEGVESFMKILDSETEIMLTHRAEGQGNSEIRGWFKESRAGAMSVVQQVEEAFYKRDITPTEVANEVNNAANQALKILASGIGEELFSNLMELKVGEKINIVDPNLVSDGFKLE